MASVVCAYQIKSVHEVVEHGSEQIKLACCSLHSGEVCWVTHDSLSNCRADLQCSPHVPIQLPVGLERENAQTVVDVIHPYPVSVEAMFQRLCRIEALLRNTRPVVTTYDTPEQSAEPSPVPSCESETPANSHANASTVNDFDDILRDIMGDDFGGLECMI